MSTGPFTPLFLEMGLGVDLVGEDMTKAACRAAREAIGRTSLPGVGLLLPDADRAGLTRDRAVALMIAQPSLIKRPVLDIDGRLVLMSLHVPRDAH